MRSALSLAAVAGCTAVLISPLGAQSAPAVITSWSPFLGCWSTSSAGAIGPMVCVVPGDSHDEVEFMTVDGDSVIARTVLDASGRRVATRRPGCTGWENGRWAADGQQLLMHAEYRCKDRRVQQSDAILSLTRTDAFTHVERNITDARMPARVVNFIVQLDTTVFPREVRRRLPYLRPLAIETSELEITSPVTPGVVVEAASSLDPDVVQTWLADRGQLSPESSTMTRLVYNAARGRQLPQPFARAPRMAVRNGLNRFGSVGVFSLTLPVYLTADHGMQPEPIGGAWAYWNIGMYNPSQTIGVPFRWP